MANLNELLNKYGNGNNPKFDYDNERKRQFIKLNELEMDKPYTIHAMFINTKGNFGDQGVIITEDYNVNLPMHLTDLIKEMRQDSDVIDAINERQLAFKPYSFVSKKYNRESYSFDLVQSEDEKK